MADNESKETTGAAVAKRPATPLEMVKSLLSQDQYKARFEEVLRDKTKASQFMASITNLVAGSKQLQRCKPSSVIAAAFIGACLDLPIEKNLGYTWIVPYGDMATFIVGWKGYVQLALRTGLYAGMNAFPVNAEALGPYDEIGERQIYFDKLDHDKEAVGYACAWKLTTGFVKVCYWSKQEVDAHAKRYSAAFKANKKDSPWFTETDKMRLKTVVANSLKRWGLMSIETRQMQIAERHDQGAQEFIDAEVTYPDNGEEEAAAEPADLIAELSSGRGGDSEEEEEVTQRATEADSTPMREPGEEDVTDEDRQRVKLEELFDAIAEKESKAFASDTLENGKRDDGKLIGKRLPGKVRAEDLDAAIKALGEKCKQLGI